MKKLIEIIKAILGIKKAVETVQYRIYMPGEPIPYDESTIEDVECEIIR